MHPRQTVTIRNACTIVGVTRRTIYNWIALGKIEFLRTAGGQIRIYEDSLWQLPTIERVA
jgi:excisionase family DNA binding protein